MDDDDQPHTVHFKPNHSESRRFTLPSAISISLNGTEAVDQHGLFWVERELVAFIRRVLEPIHLSSLARALQSFIDESIGLVEQQEAIEENLHGLLDSLLPRYIEKQSTDNDHFIQKKINQTLIVLSLKESRCKASLDRVYEGKGVMDRLSEELLALRAAFAASRTPKIIRWVFSPRTKYTAFVDTFFASDIINRHLGVEIALECLTMLKKRHGEEEDPCLTFEIAKFKQVWETILVSSDVTLNRELPTHLRRCYNELASVCEPPLTVLVVSLLTLNLLARGIVTTVIPQTALSRRCLVSIADLECKA